MDDELTALALQLEELEHYSDTRKGKHPVGQKPNIEVVYDEFCAELRDYKSFLEDQKLAKSIGEAVQSDSRVIADISQQEAQASEDHCFAWELSQNDPKIETPPSHVGPLHANFLGRLSMVVEAALAPSRNAVSDDETEAGPSMSPAERHADILNKFSIKSHCCACAEQYPQASLITLNCDDKYCINCIKGLFMRSTRDESLYPPRCCKKPIPLALIAKHMSPVELATFEFARDFFYLQASRRVQIESYVPTAQQRHALSAKTRIMLAKTALKTQQYSRQGIWLATWGGRHAMLATVSSIYEVDATI
ncbi:ariadne RING finger [Curvularia clavata]|uniref:Ariadne RING finger n=1 Tax=Curvularia clavata TaxID=95742 RepID=A0A9Q9DVL5_CURCL|nr:ariadne RING finger [Curvularia clavata]